LRQEAEELLAELPELSSGSPPPPLRHELMQSQVEVVTGICETVEEATADLVRNLDSMRQVLRPWGTTLVCAGTHPMDNWRDQKLSPGERYRELIEQMQWTARRILTCGVHVHVGVRHRDKAIPMVNALAKYLPHFLALSASSPSRGGRGPAVASARSSGCVAVPP